MAARGGKTLRGNKCPFFFFFSTQSLDMSAQLNLLFGTKTCRAWVGGLFPELEGRKERNKGLKA